MRKPTTKPQNDPPKTQELRSLSVTELQQVTGGVLKTRHDTVKNT
jgi:hypothetical protein